MKKKEKLDTIRFLLLLILLVGLIPTFSHLILGNLTANSSYSRSNDTINIKSSDWWDLFAENITIDGGATGVGAHNWTWAVTQDWCSGLGTWASPYIIENITINCNGSNYGISIQDSKVYFRIQNCTILNSGNDFMDSAILLGSPFDSVTNGTIYNNTLYSNRDGIYMQLGNNITISENIIKNNTGAGIYSSSSSDIRIIGNTFKNSDIRIYGDYHTVIGNIIKGTGSGIYSNHDYHNITGNTITNCSNGISLEYSEGNNVEGNHLNNNSRGINLKWVSGSNFTSNELNDNKYNGIWFEVGCRDNNFTDNSLTKSGVGFSWGQPFDQMVLYEPIDSSNTINSRPIYFYVNETGFAADKFTNAGQVILINCNDSLISNANTSFSTHGIYLSYCENVTMTGCDISNNKRTGLLIEHGAYNKLLNSTVNNNGLDIDGEGIGIYNSPHAYLYNNTVKNSFRGGIQLGGSDYSSLIDNIVKYNGVHSGPGIEVSSGVMCEVIGNTAKDNHGVGILISGNYSKIANNIINGNQYGISILSEHNNVSGNIASHNTDSGFTVWGDHNEFNENIANLNGEEGFYFQQTDFHTLINNSVSYNTQEGIYFEDCDNITILENTVLYHDWGGIRVENSENYNITNNNLLNNQDSLYLKDSKYILISNNVMHGDTGVYGWGLNHSIIIENNLDYNAYSSVSITDSEDNLISDNTMNFCDNALNLGNSMDCVISNNDINFNLQRGIWIYQCGYNEVLNNNASYNAYGLWMTDSSDLLVSGNTFNNNSNSGIVMVNGRYNEITLNTINNNTLNGIHLFDDSTANIISNNILYWNNNCIVEVDSGGNSIFGNDCINRPTPPVVNGDGEVIPGYDVFLLVIIITALTALICRKRKNKFKF